MLSRTFSLMALAASIALAATCVDAATDSGELTVTATIRSGCALDEGTLAFGQYISGQANDIDIAGEIRYVNCTGVLRMSLDGGRSSNINQRRMVSTTNASAALFYQLYVDRNRNVVWSTGGNAGGVTITTQTPQSGSIPVYGRLFGGQTSPSGEYTDTVNITMSF